MPQKDPITPAKIIGVDPVGAQVEFSLRSGTSPSGTLRATVVSAELAPDSPTGVTLKLGPVERFDAGSKPPWVPAESVKNVTIDPSTHLISPDSNGKKVKVIATKPGTGAEAPLLGHAVVIPLQPAE